METLTIAIIFSSGLIVGFVMGFLFVCFAYLLYRLKSFDRMIKLFQFYTKLKRDEKNENS